MSPPEALPQVPADHVLNLSIYSALPVTVLIPVNTFITLDLTLPLGVTL